MDPATGSPPPLTTMPSSPRSSQLGCETAPGPGFIWNHPLATIQNVVPSLPHSGGAAGRSTYVGHAAPSPFWGLGHTSRLVHPEALCSLADATKITLAPSSADINLGDNLTLQCHASHDPTMDLTFVWALDDFPIDPDKPGGHYRRASVVRPGPRTQSTPSVWVDKEPKMALTPQPDSFPSFSTSF